MLAKTTLAATALSLLATVPSFGGECPAEHVRELPRILTPGTGPGYDGAVAASHDLTGWRDMGNFMLRLRTLTIPAGGVVGEHSHEDRPAIVHIISGELTEHNAFCDVPIVHVAGDTVPEFGDGHRHWWENPTDTPALAISADVVPFEAMDESSM